MRISTSRASTYLRCPKFFKYLYIHEREPREPDESLEFGSRWHELMEARWNGITPVIVTDPVNKITRHSVEVLKTALEVYSNKWPLTEQVVEVEQGHVVPLGDDELEVRFDAVVKFNGGTYLVEHKTTGSDISPGSLYWERLVLDQQLSWYYLAAGALGYKISGVLYDVFRKPALRRTQRETPEQFTDRVCSAIRSDPDKHFVREVVTRSKRDSLKAEDNLHQISKMISNELYPQNPRACFDYGRRCGYWDVCNDCASLGDDSMFRNREKV